jgi:hypothetical protein
MTRTADNPKPIPDARSILADAERAARAGELDDARRLYLDAGDRAAIAGNWTLATRCFRYTVELDFFDIVAVQRLATMTPRATARAEWAAYMAALRGGTLAKFAATSVQLVVSNSGAEVVASPVGVVLEVLLSGDDLVEAHPAPAFDMMPLAMALLVVRRALWPVKRSRPATAMTVRVAYRGRQPVKLDELGDWDVGAG